MSDERISPSPTIGAQAARPSDPALSAPTVAGDTTDPGLATGAYELPSTAGDPPSTVHDTGPVDPGQATGVDATGVFDATGPQPTDATADSALSTQSDFAPTGAFEPAEGATGAFDPTNEGGNGARLAATEFATRDAPRVKQRQAADSDGPKARCGNYVLKKFFAKGGMGEVWLAEDPAIGRSVALKRMLGKRADQQVRFRVEAQITGQLEHPGIVPVHELGSNAEGEPYYVMKFVEGRTLQKVIQEFHDKKLTDGAREVEQLKLLQMFLSLCQTVGYAHSRGVLHRDLKPENVMLGPFGETILLDWGIAKVLGQDDPVVSDEPGPSERLRQSIPDTETHAGAIMGTPSYMAPEVAAGLNEEVDERSDIYLLGGTLYQILSGHQPRSAKTIAEIIKKAKAEPPKPVRTINPLVPKALEAICLKAMAHAKADRYQTATELAEEIQRFVAGEPVTAYPEGFPARAWRWAKRNRRALGLSAAAVLIGSAALFAAVKVRDAEQRRAVAMREANRLKAQEQARVDLKEFRHLADEANFFAATTNPASEHAPYFDPQKGAVMSRAALALARPWGPELESLPLPEERTAVKNELYDLLILTASETLRAEPGHAGATQALATLDRAVRMSGSSVSDSRLRARAYEHLGDETRAAEMRRRADDPKTPRTALDLFLLGERERDESAARVGDQTDRKPWQLDPDRMRKAIAFYRQALAIDPDDFWSRLQLGRCLQSLGRFPEAAEALGACVAIRPKAPWGYSALGLALAEQGRYAEAELVLNQAVGIDADSRPPRLHRGVVYWRQKKYDLAVADFEAVLAPPDDKQLVEAAYYRGQLYLERGEVQKALEDFDRVVAATPGFRSVYLDRPLIYLSRGDAPHALADLDKYISLVRKIDAGGWELHGLRGRLLRFLYTELPQEKASGPTGQAMLSLGLAELNQAVKMGGNKAGLFDDLGAMWEHAGQIDHAIAAYSRGIALAPDFAKLRLERGWAYQLLNQRDKAAADFAAAARTDPKNAEAHTGLGYIQALRKLPPEALLEAELALLHGSDEYLILHNSACIYAALSQTDGALTMAYQEVSVALLRQALKLWKKSATGPSELDLIRADPAFKPIQGRKDFQELLRSEGDAL
jgi:tetratricopeptide (TPR) repeat protein/tRNA A-37 threonylcarbamoyl transferase component Bud32